MRALALLFALAAVACAAPPQRQPATVPTTAAPAPSNVQVRVQAPARAAWISSTLGPTKPTMQVVVKNDSAFAIDVSDFRVHLEAVRDGVSFECAESVGPEPGAREPRMLAAGGSYVFERRIDCGLPLTGRYVVRVAASFGNGEWRRPQPIRTFGIDVVAVADTAPRPLGRAAPGLFAALGASPVIGGESGVGKGRIAVLLVNGSAAPLVVPKAYLALRVFRAGSSIPCEDEPMLLDTGVLEAGQSFRKTLEVSCLGLGTPGKYEVVARLLVGEETIPIGALRVEITNDPSRRAPAVN